MCAYTLNGCEEIHRDDEVKIINAVHFQNNFWSNLIYSHLNLAYQLLQAQHPLESASERCFSLILSTSLSLSLELARKQIYTSHLHQHAILISFCFFFYLTSKGGHLNQSTARPHPTKRGVLDNRMPTCRRRRHVHYGGVVYTSKGPGPGPGTLTQSSLAYLDPTL